MDVTVTVQQVLDKYGVGLSEQEFAVAMDADLARRSAANTATLSASERETLLEAGVSVHDVGPIEPAEIVRRQADLIVDLATQSCGADDAARMLGISASRVRHRIADGSLHGFRLGTRLRLPLWQFTDGEPVQPLPHLRTILGAAPTGVTPVELAAFMTTSQPDLVLGGQPATPRAWLLAGQRPDPVGEMLDGLYQW